MELHLNRKLLSNEEVDHIDNNIHNNSIDNLQILSKKENIKKEIIRSGRKKKMYLGICPVCDNSFSKPMNYVKNNRKRGKAGPFCSRQCAGKFSKTI